MARVGQLDLLDPRPEPLEPLQVRLEGGGDIRLDALGVMGEVARDADRQPVEVLAVGELHAALDPDRGRVAAVAALHDPEQQGGVGDVAGQRPALVQRRGEGDHPVARDRPVGRLQADDPAERRRLADRAAGVGADRPRREAPGDGGRRAARRAARHAGAVPRVEHRAVGRVLVRRAHRELVHVGLAEQPGAGLVQAAHGGRRVRRPVALEDPRPGGGRDALGAEEVLDRDRQAAQRLAASARATRARRATGRRSARRLPPPPRRRRSTRRPTARRPRSAAAQPPR